MKDFRLPKYYCLGFPFIFADEQLYPILDGSECEASQVLMEGFCNYFVKLDEKGNPVIDENVVPKEALEGLHPDCWQFLYNDGKYPFVPRKPEKVALVASRIRGKGYDYAVCTVEDMYFRPHADKDGKVVKLNAFGTMDDYEINDDPDGPLCDWDVVFRIGEVLEKHYCVIG